MFDSHVLSALILALAFVGLFVELYRHSGLRGRPRHHYRHVPQHMRQAGSINPRAGRKK